MKNLIQKIRKYFSKERIISLSMLGKILSLVVVLTFAPATFARAEEDAAVQSFQSDLKLDTTTWGIVVLPQVDQYRFELTESNYDRAEREKREQEVQKSSRARSIIARDYRPAPVDPNLSTKRSLVKKAAAQYGIDWKILEAVWQVESGKAWDTSVRSYAGAGGPMQFMPSTWRKYAQDGNGDGRADMYSAEDAVFGAAQLLAQSGADRGDINSALLSYNHAQWYVEKVKAVASSIAD